MTDHSIQSPTKITSDAAEGEYYDDLITQFGTRLSPPRVVDDVQHAIEALNALGLQGAQGPQGVQGPQGDTGAQGPQGDFAISAGSSGSSTPTAFSNAEGNPPVLIPDLGPLVVPNPGTYLVQFDVSFAGGAIDTRLTCQVFVNGVAAATIPGYPITDHQAVADAGGSDSENISGHGLYALSAGNSIEIRGHSAEAGSGDAETSSLRSRTLSYVQLSSSIL